MTGKKTLPQAVPPTTAPVHEPLDHADHARASLLARLRRRRLDGAVGSVAEERELVKEWLTSGKEA